MFVIDCFYCVCVCVCLNDSCLTQRNKQPWCITDAAKHANIMKQIRDGIIDEITYNNAHPLFEMNGDLHFDKPLQINRRNP